MTQYLDTKILLTLTAIVLGVLGVGGTFLPQEILARAGVEPTTELVLVVQVAGALYFGFALLDWMARDSIMGGVYGRPVTMGNFVHFLIVALALVRLFFAGAAPLWLVFATGTYVLFAAAYGVLLFGAARSRSS